MPEEKEKEQVEEQTPAEGETPEGEAAGSEAATEAAAAEASAEEQAAAEESTEEAAPAEEAEPATAGAEMPAAVEKPAPEPTAVAAPAEELTYDSLSSKTVAELRDIAQGQHHDALKGYSTMHKEQLVPALCAALGIEAHVHHEVVGIDKEKAKGKIRALKEERDRALEAGDSRRLQVTRRRIRSLKRKIRKATV